MKHPTKEAVLKVSNVFRELSENEEYKVQFENAHITRQGCDTAACHAGWYLYHKHKNNGYWASVMEGSHIQYFTPSGSIVKKIDERSLGENCLTPVFQHMEGADLMAINLGFKDSMDLKKWARENPEIWGNKYGEMMFSAIGEEAFFGEDGMFEITLSVIADHWESVAGRIPTASDV